MKYMKKLKIIQRKEIDKKLLENNIKEIKEMVEDNNDSDDL